MLVTEIQTAARDLYNATGDSFFGDTQINNWITQACNEIAVATLGIERTYSSSTVANQQDYAYPTNTMAIKRITVNGKKLKRVTLRQDDALTLSNQNSTQTGFPIYYTDFNETISMRPIPDAAYTIKIYSLNMAQPIVNTSALEVQTQWHFFLVDYILFRMFSKDKDIANAQMHKGFWMEHLATIKAWKAKQKRSDSFTTVQDEETLPVTIMGEV